MTAILNHPLSLFLITLIISFLGSVQPGVVNIMASRLMLTRGKRYTLAYSAAASIPEIIYAFIAAYYVGSLQISAGLQLGITAFAGMVLIGFGSYLLFNPPKVEVTQGRFDNPVVKGLLLSMTNPQLIIFWSGMVIVYKRYGIHIEGNLSAMVWFALGAAIGAFLLLIGYMKLSNYYLNDLNDKKINILNKISAYILIIIGIIATLGLLF